jgi:hypothetical protein
MQVTASVELTKINSIGHAVLLQGAFMFNGKNQSDFEMKALIYAHRVLLVLFLGTLIVIGAMEACNRVRGAIPVLMDTTPTPQLSLDRAVPLRYSATSRTSL